MQGHNHVISQLCCLLWSRRWRVVAAIGTSICGTDLSSLRHTASCSLYKFLDYETPLCSRNCNSRMCTEKWYTSAQQLGNFFCHRMGWSLSYLHLQYRTVWPYRFFTVHLQVNIRAFNLNCQNLTTELRDSIYISLKIWLLNSVTLDTHFTVRLAEVLCRKWKHRSWASNCNDDPGWFYCFSFTISCKFTG